MKMKIRVEDRMAVSMSWVFALIFFLVCLGFGFSYLLLITCTVLLISMMFFFFTISKRKSFSVEEFVEEEKTIISDQKSSPVLAPTRKSTDLLSESECGDDNFTATEESEVEWPFLDHRMAHNLDFSDGGSISDEESLIEISLPTGHYVVSHKVDDEDEEEEEEDDDDTVFHLQKLSDFQKQKHLVELLAEINDFNEEENLIEIDISMGSIKCSRFEIEA